MDDTVKIERLIDEDIRKAVALAIETKVVLDVDDLSDLIAMTHGFRVPAKEIAAELAKAAAAANVPIQLSDSRPIPHMLAERPSAVEKKVEAPGGTARFGASRSSQATHDPS